MCSYTLFLTLFLLLFSCRLVQELKGIHADTRLLLSGEQGEHCGAALP